MLHVRAHVLACHVCWTPTSEVGISRCLDWLLQASALLTDKEEAERAIKEHSSREAKMAEDKQVGAHAHVTVLTHCYLALDFLSTLVCSMLTGLLSRSVSTECFAYST